jgi:putative IMPACT (imprinted ancient) family translation regulator
MQDLDNVLVVVTRFYGGIQLGPDRFKHINHVARKALEVGGFLDAPESSSGRKAHSRNKKHG